MSTPGPWEVWHDGYTFAVRDERTKHVIAYTNRAARSREAALSGIDGDHEREANAVLMAAAPILLNAAQIAIDTMEQGSYAESHLRGAIEAALLTPNP